MPAGQITGRLNLNAAGWSSAVDQAIRETKKLQDATKNLGHGTVNSMQASSAAIRVLEGGMTGNIRAAERFISMLPGVGKALQAAFPVIGGIALAGVFVKIGEEAAKAIKTVETAQQNIDNSFRSLNLGGQTANDTLAITNDRLENEIAKLQGKPQNNLALAIDEARKAADEMASSLDRDNAKIKELLSQNAVPWWAGFLGKAGTSNVTDTINAQNQHLSDLSAKANVAQHEGNTDEADRLRTAIDAKRSEYLQANAKDILDRQANQNLPGGLNQGANISALQGQQGSLYNQFDQESELARNVADEKQKAQLQGAKDLADADKKAQEAIVAQWHKDLDDQKGDSDMTVAQEGQFWVRRMESAKYGSLSYKAALDEANKDIARERSENMRGQKEFDKSSFESYLPGASDISRGDVGQLGGQGRSATDYIKNLNDGITLQRQNANAIAEASLRTAEMAGQVSSLDAAQARAALHAQEYGDATAALALALKAAQSLPEGLDKQAVIAGLNKQGTQIAGERSLQVMQDQQGISGAQTGQAIKTALDQMVQSFTDMAAELKSVIPHTIESLNSNIVKAVTGQGKRGDFGRTFMQAGQGLLKTGLQGVEGRALGFLGLGKKADGSSELAALWVRIAAGNAAAASSLGTTSGSPGSLIGDLAKMPPGGQFIQPFLAALPHFATGGDVAANSPIMVGENGPEPFIPRTAGTILPTGSLGGDTHFHIDARGSTDPAALRAAVMSVAPHIVAASMQAQRQSSSRNPGSR